MKRLIGVLGLAAALATILVVPAATAKERDYKGPACNNFTFGDPAYTYDSSTSTGTVGVTMSLAAPACAGTTYSLDISSLDGNTSLFTDVPGTASDTTVTFSKTFSPAPSDGVCLVAYSIQGGHVSDRAPDIGCEQVVAGSSGGGGGMN